jgi:uncharacterized membrane protein YfcA
MAYGALGLAAWRPRMEARAGLPAGAATGALAAVTGVFVIPAVPWLLLASALARQALGARLRRALPEARFRQAFFAGLLALGLAILLRA